MKKTKIVTIALLMLLLVTLSGCGCKQTTAPQYKVSLEIWGFMDDSYTFSKAIENYKKINPNIDRIEYKKVAIDTYKKELIDALAAGKGPDVFLIHNDWLPNFSDKILPAPTEVLNEQKIKKYFVDVAAADFIDQNKVWAVPLSVDSMALYYNKDFFNAAGIVSPPTDWKQFTDDVERLTVIDAAGEITRSGAAIGTAYNINRSTDILNLLMLQNGTEIVDANGGLAISRGKSVNNEIVVPAENALNFYTSFAKRESPFYSWNTNMHYSVDAFSEGLTAMMINYSWQAETISEKSPKLNFAVAPLPQFAGSMPVNYANYWGYAVAKNKSTAANATTSSSDLAPVSNDVRVAEAWKFLTYLTTKPESSATQAGVVGYDPAAEYLKTTGRPAARRDIIETQKTDPKISVFATGNLIARSWRKYEPEAVEAIFAEIIDQVNRGQIEESSAVNVLESRISKLLVK
jgi:multiple sugar transport system substrate-binding protein